MNPISEFDEVFKGIAVPITRDYSRFSASFQDCSSQYVDDDSSYFQRDNRNPPVECDTPVKMKLPKDSEAEMIIHTNENFLNGSGSTSSGSTKSVALETREPLKVTPSNEPDQLIVDFSKMAMFAPQQPEERISQRRRSEQKQKEERRSVLNSKSNTVSSTNRARSNSVQRDVSSIPRAPSVPRTTSSVPRSRSSSVNRNPIAPKTATTTGVVTRSMAKLTQHNNLISNKIDPVAPKPAAIRRSVMPLKVATETPNSTSMQITNSRSRDRTRRVNTTAQMDPTTRRSIMTNRTNATPQAARSSSLPRATIKNPTITKTRPIATANRTSVVGSSVQKKENDTITKKPVVGSVRNRVPLRVKPSTPVSTARPAVSSVGKSTRLAEKPTATSSSMKSAGSETDLAQKKPISSVYANALFNRLSTPKSGPTSRAAPITNTPKQSTTSRKSVVRPVPSFVRSVNSAGLPTGAGTHGIRAVSRGRTPSKERIRPVQPSSPEL